MPAEYLETIGPKIAPTNFETLAAIQVVANGPSAITFMIPFDKVRDKLEGLPAPRRPNRNRPISELLAMETPTDSQLVDMAQKNPPPSDYFDGDMQRPW